MSGNSEAVRLPKEVAFGPGVELVIARSGDVMTIYPANASTRPMADLVERLNRLPAPASVEDRDAEEIPEPEGL